MRCCCIFREWQDGELGAFEWSQKIHEFHQRVARDLYCRYEDNSYPDLLVGRAIIDGVIEQNEIAVGSREYVLIAVEKLR